MRWLTALLLSLALPLTAAAQTLPSLFAVVDVAEDDVLNIRAQPGSSSAIVGSLAWNAGDIEVTSLDATGKWGQINIDEQSAWVSMRYLRLQPFTEAKLLPHPLTCFGNEPFWALEITNGATTELRRMDGDPLWFPAPHTVASASMTGRYAMIAEDAGRSLFGFVERKTCSDGMSDRAYGLDVNLLIRDGNEIQYLSGCCSVTP